MFYYKITNIPRYISHKELFKVIKEQIDLSNNRHKLSYKPNSEHAKLICHQEIPTVTELIIKKNICNIVQSEEPFIDKNKKFKNVILQPKSEYDIRNSVTPLWNMPYENQIEHKKTQIEKFYKRKIEYFKTTKFERNNFQFRFGFDHLNIPMLGYLSKIYIHEHNLVFDVQNCNNISPKLIEKINVIKNLISDKPALIYDSQSRTGFFRSLLVRNFNEEYIALLQLYDPNYEFLSFLKNNADYECGEKKSLFLENYKIIKLFPFDNLHIQCFNARFNGFVPSKTFSIRGDNHLHYKILDRTFKVSFFSFFQTNLATAENLCIKLREHQFKNKKLYDFCCGSGFFSIILSNYFRAIIGVEIENSSIEDALVNININEIKNIKIVKDDVTKFQTDISDFSLIPQIELNPIVNKSCDTELLNEKKNTEIINNFLEKTIQNQIDIKEEKNNSQSQSLFSFKDDNIEKCSMILDPPRRGVSKKTIQNIRKNDNINEIIYISCDYKASYGNILDLCKNTSNSYKNEPFRIQKVLAFDMFPNTENSEVVLILIR
ncbi:hypothetical protein EDEG_00953 [Edhazardia aedis USNM 41457]|uniref:tRNA (Uracil-5-)-methyltransferase n=1 Tax=Edhazardia aedis (strain USNM 41457) TaxID=1003232 RepID=J9DQM1_EDHAE|nr:hypothetical protein EDEG_00953 [Edhazardia aedis USNM 41457]|eukprot:EJW04860.1 hypothetical protein EDEG_00953 [Edhazardia aedis USNM 41457]